MTLSTERKLATVRTIRDLQSIEGADRIEIAVVDGWRVIVKKGDFWIGDKAIYLEIDSWVPHDLAPFLTKEGKTPKVYKDILGERLRTVKMKGEISQGLLIVTDQDLPHQEGEDLTEELGVLKWERDIPTQPQGKIEGNFPSFIPKTDQERIQNLRKELQVEDSWEVTVKLDGSSMTCFIDEDDKFWVCSRNWKLEETEDSAFWKAARNQDLESKLREINDNYYTRFAIQGELIGLGIQGNQEQLKEVEFFLFDIFDINTNKYLLPDDRQFIVDVDININHVPYLKSLDRTPTVEEALELAEGSSLNADVQRKGVVFKSYTRPGVSFKAISNKWLLAGGD